MTTEVSGNDALHDLKSLSHQALNSFWSLQERQRLRNLGGALLSAARVYFPELGIFAERDPQEPTARDPISFNPYLLGRANPFRWHDPDGRAPISRDLADRLHEERASAVTRVNAAKMGIVDGPWYAMPGLLLLGAADFAYGVATGVTGAAAETSDLAADVAIAGLDNYVDLGDVGQHSSQRVLGDMELAAAVASAIADDPTGSLGRGAQAIVDPYAQAFLENDTAAQMGIVPNPSRAMGDTMRAMAAAPGPSGPGYGGLMTISESGLVPHGQSMMPGSLAHKSQRWEDYQARKSGDTTALPYDQWERRYDVAMRNSSLPLQREQELRDATGGQNIVLATPTGPRQVDSGVLEQQELYQLKTGHESLSTKSSKLGTRSNEAARVRRLSPRLTPIPRPS